MFALPLVVVLGAFTAHACAQAVRPPTPAPTQPLALVAARICAPRDVDYNVAWKFVAPYLLCYLSDQHSGTAKLFVRNTNGSFSPLSHGGGDLPLAALVALGVPVDAAKQLLAWPPPSLLNQRVVLGDVAATVIVYPPGGNEFYIQVHFESSTYPIGCLSAYQDLQYELFDATNNRTIPINQQAVEHPPFNEGQVVNHVVKGANTGSPCSSNAPMGVWKARARLSVLYPNLPPGKYTLQIIFAPRGIEQRATFSAFPISVEAH